MLKLIQHWLAPKTMSTSPQPAEESGKRVSTPHFPSAETERSQTGTRRLFLPLGGDSDRLLSLVADLETMLSESTDEYCISILGPDGIMPDIALAIHHLIKNRPHPGRVVIQSLGSLLNSDVLVWLAADERTLRPGAWIRFEPLPTNGPGRPRRRPHPAFSDYAQVLKLVEQYLPAEFAGRAIYEAEIAEWGLIEQPPLTQTTPISKSEKPDDAHM